jgi:hypothetical protein
MINFYVLKWGTKYDASYVNALYRNLHLHCSSDFILNCITDEPEGIDGNVTVLPFSDFDRFLEFPRDRVFTREKAVIMKTFNTGRNVILDLDIRFVGDPMRLLSTPINYPHWIKTHWNFQEQIDSFHSGASCGINGSFISWDGNAAEFIYDHLWEYREEAFYTYDSFDIYVWYQHCRKGKIGMMLGPFYSYIDCPKPAHAIAAIFNTSHRARQGLPSIDVKQTDLF